MTRRGTGFSGQRSPFIYRERRPNYVRPLLLGAIALAVVIVGAFLVLRACGSDSCSSLYCSSSQDLPAPQGFERVTSVFERNLDRTVSEGQNLAIALPLSDGSDDGRNLSFYEYQADTRTWAPLVPAVINAEGKAAATFTTAPATIAVMRRLSPGGEVVAYLQPGKVIHPDAASRVTVLHTLDFKPASDGSITGEPTPLSATGIPASGGVAQYPTISASGADTGVIPILSGILADAGSRSNHVQQILATVAGKQLAGIDIAYLDLPASERTSFALFIAELGQALHAQDKKLTVTLPPPTRTGDRIDEGAYDWGEISQYADLVQIAPYRDQSTYRRDMPEILAHLVQVVQPASKLVLTVTPMAAEKSPEGIRSLDIATAMTIATRLQLQTGADETLTTSSNVQVVGININQAAGRSGISWQPQTATVAFAYEQNGGRTVWLENFYSIGFKLELISQYNLGGVAVEDASNDPYLGNIWTAVVPFVTTGQPILLQPDPEDLVPKWKVSAGSMESGRKGALTWTTPPEPGTYTISLTLSDGVARFENEISVTVQPRQNASGTPTAAPGTGG